METVNRVKHFSNSTEFFPFLVIGLTMSFGSSTPNFYAVDKKVEPIEIRDPKYYANRSDFSHVSAQKKFSLDRLKQNKKIIRSLAALEEGWNGYGGRTIEPQLISQVESILPEFEIQPQIFPTGRGSIQLDFVKSEDVFLEVEISSTEIFAYRKSGEKEEELELDFSELILLANEFNA